MLAGSFSLAKAITPDVAADSAAPSMSPTMTSTGSVVGMILGTASYMSPEQAKGKPVDRRADIWSFGVVLFELFSGRRLFEGESISETLAAVLLKDPDWSALPSNTPAKVRRLLQRCLTRDPKNRLQDIGEARIALQEVLAGEMDVAEAETIGPAPSWSRRALPWLGAGVLIGLAVGWGVVSLRGSPQTATETNAVMRFTVPALESVEDIRNFAPAPDDRYVVYQGYADEVPALYQHDFESGNSRRLEGTEGGIDPFLSADGRWVGFHRETDLMKLRLSGGDAVKICDVSRGFPGATWGPDGRILFPRGWLQGLWSVSADGGEPVQLTTVNLDAGEKGHWWPRFLPDGRHALFTIWNAGAGLIDADVAVLDVETGEYRKLVRGADAWFLPAGHIVFYRAGSYHAIAFDPDTLEVTGDSVPVLADATDPLPQGSPNLGLAISARGTLLYSTQQIIPPVRLAVLKPDAAPRTLEFSARSIGGLALSSDGRTVATDNLESGMYFIRLLDLQNGTDELVDLTGSNWKPHWKPDGSGFAFLSMRKGDFDIYFKDVRAAGAEQPLRVTPTDEQPLGWSVDGSNLFHRETSLGNAGVSIWASPIEDAFAESTLIGEVNANVVTASPDGAWIAYDSTRAGVRNIYVRPYPATGAEVRVSLQGGMQPAWSPDGAELYYARENSIVAISYTVEQGRFRPGNEEVLFESPLLALNFDGTPVAVLDRRTFVVTLLEAEPEPPHLNVVLNWSREVAVRLAAQ